MIIGTGIDLVSIERIQTIVGSHGSRFAEKILSPAEQGLVPEKNPFEFIAGRFAAKEALMKAMGDTLLGFTEIEILNDIIINNSALEWSCGRRAICCTER